MRRQDEIPTVNIDWWNYGGITRDVLLAEVPAAYIADYKVQLAKGDRGRIEGYVQMAQCGEGQQVTVTILEAGISKTVKTDANGRALRSLPADKLKLWSPGEPKLYQVEIASIERLCRSRYTRFS